MQRWKQRPEGSNWGDFGPDDQLGRLNLIQEAQVLYGAREIRAGKTFCLSLPLNLPLPNLAKRKKHLKHRLQPLNRRKPRLGKRPASPQK